MKQKKKTNEKTTIYDCGMKYAVNVEETLEEEIKKENRLPIFCNLW